jgi:hypothetical protein
VANEFDESPRGKQLALVTRFSAWDAKRNLQAIDKAVYSLDTTKSREAEPALTDRTGEHKPDPKGEIELTHVDDQWICGEVRIPGLDPALTGKFAARVVKK